MAHDSDLASIFKAYDIRGTVGEFLTSDTVKDIGKAFADYLPAPGQVVVGHDMRNDSANLAAAMIEGLRGQGRDVLDVGQVTSDMTYFAVGKLNLAGSAMITASHNPGKENGVKLYRDGVVAVSLDDGLDVIRDAVIAQSFKPTSANPGKLEHRDITDLWVEHCLKFVDKLAPFHIAIDAGNGMAGAILPHILPKLPLKVEELYFELDGTFPNHEANPQHLENLQDLVDTIKAGHLDFGIAFDGDGDRAAFVDDLGRPVLGTDMVSIIAHYYLQKYPGSSVVHEVRTSRATQELIREWGGTPIRTGAGRILLGRKLREIGAPFGGETTGHMFFKDNYDADAAMITALVAMQAITDTGKKLSELVDEYHRYVLLPERSYHMPSKAASVAALDKLRQAFKDGTQDDLDGLTVNYPDRWFNMRVSNTEPVIKLNAEAENRERLDSLVAKISDLVEA